MYEIKKPNWEYKITPSIFKSRRDELVARLTDGINMTRVGTKYKPISTKQVAIRVNKNPAFKGSDSELELLIKHCEEKSSYSKFFYICPIK